MFAVIERDEGEYYSRLGSSDDYSDRCWTTELQKATLFKLTLSYKEEDGSFGMPVVEFDPQPPGFYSRWRNCRLRAVNLELK